MFFGRLLISINCAIYVAIGMWAIVDPRSLLSSIDLVVLSNAGRIEMQVLIAGSMFAFSGLLCAGIFDLKQIKQSLGGLLIINGAWLLTRIIGLIDGWSENKMTYVYLGFELIMLIFAILILRIIVINPEPNLFAQNK